MLSMSLILYFGGLYQAIRAKDLAHLGLISIVTIVRKEIYFSFYSAGVFTTSFKPHVKNFAGYKQTV